MIGRSASSLSLQLLSVCPVHKVYLFNYVGANLLKRSGISVHRGLLWSTASIEDENTHTQTHTGSICPSPDGEPLLCSGSVGDNPASSIIHSVCLLTCKPFCLSPSFILSLSFPRLEASEEGVGLCSGLGRGWAGVVRWGWGWGYSSRSTISPEVLSFLQCCLQDHK